MFKIKTPKITIRLYTFHRKLILINLGSQPKSLAFYMLIFYWNMTDIQHYICFMSTALWFDSCMHCTMITTVRLFNICHHTNNTVLLTVLLMLYITFPWPIYFICGSLYLLILFIYFVHLPTTPPTDNYQFISCIYKSVLFFRFYM